MGINITLPKITATTPTEQIRQMHSYLFQVTEQLNWALSTFEKGIREGNESAQISSSVTLTEKESQATFNSIKSLIIKSADIVEAYYDEINKRLEGKYVAQSDFGTYREDTAADISANSTAISQNYTNVQTILDGIEQVIDKIDVTAHIKSGLLYYDDAGVPIYGLEIGQRNEDENGVETFNKFARFTSNKLAFYDSNDIEVAYISDKKLYITHVEVTGSFKMGGFVDTVLEDLSVVTKYLEYGGDG